MHLPFASSPDHHPVVVELVTTLASCCSHVPGVDSILSTSNGGLGFSQAHAATLKPAAPPALPAAARNRAAANQESELLSSTSSIQLLRALLFRIWPVIQQLPCVDSPQLVCQEESTPLPLPLSTAATTECSRCNLLDTWVHLVCAISEQGKLDAVMASTFAGRCACMRASLILATFWCLSNIPSVVVVSISVSVDSVQGTQSTLFCCPCQQRY